MRPRLQQGRLRLFELEAGDLFTEAVAAHFFFARALLHPLGFQLGFRNGIFLEELFGPAVLVFGQVERGFGPSQLSAPFIEGRFGAFDAGFSLRQRPGVEQAGVGRFDRGQHSPGGHLVSGPQLDAPQSPGQWRRHHVPVSHASLAVFFDRHLQHAGFNPRQIDRHGLGEKGVDNRGRQPQHECNGE